ncbi:MAG: hypothetical protein AAF085_15395, partial [Planctomycetota bacterium]
MPLFARLLLMLLFFATAICPATAEPTFKHSLNAQRTLKKHGGVLDGLKAGYFKAAEQAGKRFEKTAQRHVDRYASLVEREVRSLTRAGEIDAATAANEMMAKVQELLIAPPDSNGLHFLSKQNTEVPGSDKVTKYGVDLLVDIESAGVLYGKQLDIAFESYETKVIVAWNSLKADLEKVLNAEQRAGRLDAVREIKTVLDSQKNAPEIPRPSLEKKAGPAKGDPPAYLGYHIIEYHSGFMQRERFIVRISEDDGMLASRYVRKTTGSGTWETLDIPVKIESQDKKLLVISHKDGQRETEVVHELWIDEGKLVQSFAWRSKKDYKSRRDAAQGSVNAI